MRRFGEKIAWRSAVLGTLLGFFPILGWPQKYTKSDREFAERMLRDVAADVQQRYYDPKLHGIDWNVRVQAAKRNIDTADSLNSAVSEIAALLDSLNDSHTSFSLPPRGNAHDYGFKMKMIGEHC